MRGLAAALALLLAAVLLGGCGGGDSSEPPIVVDPDLAVTDQQVAAAPAGTPQRSVLEWWRDVQVNDPEHARGLYASPPTLPNLAGQFNFVEDRLDGGVEVVAVKRNGPRRVVTVGWTPPDKAERRVALRLVRETGTWKLLDTRFVDELVVRLQQRESGAG